MTNAENYVVWKRMGKTTIEIGRFRWKGYAETFMRIQSELYKSAKFQITNVGETPVWEDDENA